MYDTALGIRVLYGSEAQLFASGAWTLTDQLRSFVSDPESQSCNHLLGIDVLDSLTAAQVIVLVDRVTEYLLDPSTIAPVRTAVLDATIAAVFQQIATDVLSEIEFGSESTAAEDNDTSIRTRVAAASLQTSDPQSSPDFACAVMETWEFVIDRLRDRVLPDTDWQLESIALDLEPHQSTALKAKMGIQDDYFIDVVPDASVEDAATAWCNTVQRISGWRPEVWRFGAGIPMPANADLPPIAEILNFPENKRAPTSLEDDSPAFAQVKPVLLSDVIFEIEIAGEEWSSYVDRINGEVVGLPTDAIMFVEDGENPEIRVEHGDEILDLARTIAESDDFVPLPDQFEIHEWAIMRDFCANVESESDRSDLLDAVHGNGAFRHFKSTIDRLDLKDQWFSYRDAAIEAFVINWLESSSIQWSRTEPGESPF